MPTLLRPFLACCALSALLLASPLQADGDLFDRTAARHSLSADLLRSIALVESGMYPWAVNINWETFLPETPYQAVHLIRNVQQRPWMLRLEYADDTHRLFFRHHADAEQGLQSLLARARLLDAGQPLRWEIRKLDVRSVDIGLMQINWKFHGRHFESIQQLFDPATNLDYAARYLKSLLQEHGELERAVAHYHSNTQEFQDRYLQSFRTIYQKQRNLAGSG